MKKSLLVLVSLVGAGLVAWFWISSQWLRREVNVLQQMRGMRVRAILGPRMQERPALDGDVALRKGYERMANAYLKRDRLELATAMASLPASKDLFRCEISSHIDVALSTAFNDTFLRTEELCDFADEGGFEAFAWVNLEVAMFYGRLRLKQKDFESLCFIEHLVYLRLKQYHDKFEREKETDLQNAARRFMDLWEAQIESPDGFTRQGIRGMYLMNSVYARACGHGPGLTRENALVMGRALANGLVKCGYRPKWLERLGDVLDEPWDGILPDDYKDGAGIVPSREER